MASLETDFADRVKGKAAREVVPRSSHGEWGPAARDPLQILARQDESRIAELVPIRYGRMLASPFAFFRGAAAVMAADLAKAPSVGIEAQLCGDAHLANFGVFSAPDRRLVFDCNDFDETCRGPFEWDVKRLAASIAVAGRERGFGAKERQRATRSGDRFGIAAYLGSGEVFDKALARFGEAYADQNERDFSRLVKAVEKGEVVAETDLR